MTKKEMDILPTCGTCVNFTPCKVTTVGSTTDGIGFNVVVDGGRCKVHNQTTMRTSPECDRYVCKGTSKTSPVILSPTLSIGLDFDGDEYHGKTSG